MLRASASCARAGYTAPHQLQLGLPLQLHGKLLLTLELLALLHQVKRRKQVCSYFCRPFAQEQVPQHPGPLAVCVQLVVGELIIAVFIFVRPAHFKQACLATTLHMVCQLLIAQDAHIGAKNIAAASLLGPSWFGCMVAGGVVSLAHAPG